eukprot:TRINITY_DN960_c0_g1_i1.p1 TRINITY_DN960_c0_g1~~TRINITY_DN960_c0_g1_i1.p1  ORF type:complete len:594 (+),score=129.30 TRINITY_DN960_c0_g1_i1:202-1983(+)
MSRHRAINKITKDAMEEDEYDEYDDDDFDEEECINEILEVVEDCVDRETVIKTLERYKWDVEKTIDAILKKKTNPEKAAPPKTTTPGQPNQASKPHGAHPPKLTHEPSKEEHKHGGPDHGAKPKDNKKKEVVRDLKKYNSPYPEINYKLTGGRLGPLAGKQNINIVIVGHVDSGKSTLTGHLLHLVKEIDRQTLNKLEREAQSINKASNKYAWVMDEMADERARGVTIDIATRKFDFKGRQITLLDAPGHRDFVPNMISGAAQADYGLLVIDVKPNAFEAGLGQIGQTKEHVKLLKSLGVTNMIICINKLDEVDYSEERYHHVVKVLLEFLSSLGFNQADLSILPISGITGENLLEITKNDNFSWYKGPTLLEIIEKLPTPDKGMKTPARMSVSAFCLNNSGKVRGHLVTGRVEGGVFIKGQKYLIMPHEIGCSIKEILLDDDKVKEAIVGDNVDIALTFENEFDSYKVMAGDVLCAVDHPIPLSKDLVLEIMTLDLDIPVIKGMRVMFHAGQSKTTGYISNLEKVFDRSSGEVIKRNPKCLLSNQCAVISVKLDNYLCVELYRNIRSFGRVTIREKFLTLAIGVVTEIKQPF